MRLRVGGRVFWIEMLEGGVRGGVRLLIVGEGRMCGTVLCRSLALKRNATQGTLMKQSKNNEHK